MPKSKFLEISHFSHVCVIFRVIRIEDLESSLQVFETAISHVYGPLCSGLEVLDDYEDPPPRLSLDVVRAHIAPSLLRIASVKSSSHCQASAQSLIGKLEAIHGTSLRPNAMATLPSSSTTISVSTSMDDVKQKMGKLFQKPTGQPFWKK